MGTPQQLMPVEDMYNRENKTDTEQRPEEERLIRTVSDADMAIDEMIMESGFQPLSISEDRSASFPQKYKMTLDRATSYAFGDGTVKGESYTELLKDNQEIDLPVSTSKGRKVYVDNFIVCTPDEGDEDDYSIDNVVPGCLTSWDRAVFCAACSLMFEGANCFTTKQILEVLSGEKTKDKVGSATWKDVDQSLMKMMCTVVKLDWADILRSHGFKIDGNVKMTSITPMLPMKGWDIKLRNGSVVSGYKMLAEPELLRLAKVLKQIGTIRIECLEADENRSRNSILIRTYLARRVSQCTNHVNQRANPVISLDTVIKKCDLNKSTPIARSRSKKEIFGALDDFVNKGVIIGYEKIKRGKETVSVKIITNESENEEQQETEE